jgi:transcriptional regulator with XRE-family HTH domain
MTPLGRLIRQTRERRGSSRHPIVERAGYRNTNKGFRRLDELESGPGVFPDSRVLTRFAAVLGIADADILLDLSQDFQEWDRPIEPYWIGRWLPGLYFNERLAEGCSMEEACAVAR